VPDRDIQPRRPAAGARKTPDILLNLTDKFHAGKHSRALENLQRFLYKQETILKVSSDPI
jgi:hypothetical protein